MSNPYQPSPYITTAAPDRPRMFGSSLAHVLWVLLPIVTVSLGAAVPFVVAAVKGVIRPWVAAVYVVAELAIFAGSTAMDDPSGGNNIIGLLLILLIIVSATHTGLLDNDKVNIGK